MKDFEYGEHTADILVIAYGRNLNELFVNAAKAVFNIITDIKKVEPKTCVEVEDEGDDLEQLLYKWIEDFLTYFDAEQLVFSKFEAKVWQEDGKWKVKGKGCGEKFDPNRHEYGTIVKAMTYHEMEIKKVDGIWRAQFVVDI